MCRGFESLLRYHFQPITSIIIDRAGAEPRSRVTPHKEGRSREGAAFSRVRTYQGWGRSVTRFCVAYARSLVARCDVMIGHALQSAGDG